MPINNWFLFLLLPPSSQFSLIFPHMASSPRTNPPPAVARVDENDLFKEVQRIFDKLLILLVAIVAFKVTDTGQHFFKAHRYLMIALVLAVFLYFSAWLLLTTALQLQIRRSFAQFITCFVLTIGVIVSVWSLIIFV